MWTLVLLAVCLAPTYGAAVGAKPDSPEKESYVGHRLVGVTPTNKEQVEFLHELGETGHLGLDFWLDPMLDHETRVRVPPNVYARFVDLLTQAGLTHVVVVEDVQGLIDNPPELGQYDMSTYNFVSGIADHTKYHQLSQINTYITGFANSFTGVTASSLPHNTYEGRSTRYLEITGGSSSNKKRIVIEAGIHAREWITPASMLYFVDRMLHERSNPGSQAEFLYNNFEWYIVPVTNPDGYSYTHTNSRLWRKNRNICSGTSSRGIDLNRNFDANFGGGGSSGSCASDTYRGPSAFSEAESRNMRDLVSSIKATKGAISAYISVHCYSQYLLTPYGYAYNTVPANDAEIRRITNLARTAILNRPDGKSYVVGTPAEILYVASGISADWARLREEIPYTMTYELRPSAGTSNGFVLPTSEIIPTGDEVWASLFAIASEL
ncbi:zinc carboxypeptidase-like [Haliotis cracherodii]|uniref:zinc carboxypeptidase-like n=1 Tax=Haliotis cracherodii TaxID=6455 RepID=UPI0039EC383A